MDVGKYATFGDPHVPEEVGQLLVVPDAELKVSWDDPWVLQVTLLVVASGIPTQFKNLRDQVLHDGGHVD